MFIALLELAPSTSPSSVSRTGERYRQARHLGYVYVGFRYGQALVKKASSTYLMFMALLELTPRTSPNSVSRTGENAVTHVQWCPWSRTAPRNPRVVIPNMFLLSQNTSFFNFFCLKVIIILRFNCFKYNRHLWFLQQKIWTSPLVSHSIRFFNFYCFKVISIGYDLTSPTRCSQLVKTTENPIWSLHTLIVWSISWRLTACVGE